MDVLDAIRRRRSVRAYSSREIPEDVLEQCRNALRWAPSACNYQPWHFVFVKDPNLRRQVALAANDQVWMAEAPIIVVACGLPEVAYQHMAGHGDSTGIDVTIALDHLTLAAAEQGLGTCWVGAFDEPKIKRLLKVPPNARVIVLTPLGYPATSDLLSPAADADRKPPEVIFSTDRFTEA